MMKSILTYCLNILLFSPVIAGAQIMTELGMMGGSGMIYTPTTTIVPESHFRLDMTRMSLTQSNAGGVNSYSMTGGLSTNMEVSAKFQSVQVGTAFSPSFIGFGGKFVLPFYLPFKSRTAIWAENVSTANLNNSAFFPSNVTRALIVVQPALFWNFNANLIAGITSVDDARRLSVGCNASVAVSERVKIGGEFLANYYGRSDREESVLILFRALPNIAVQFSPGYLQSPVLSSWMFSLGVSVSTASIDFKIPERPKEKSNVIPSFDELEKQIHEEKKKEND